MGPRFKFLSTRGGFNHTLERDEKVASLIRLDTGTWDINRVQSVFPPAIAAAVLKLVLLVVPGEDQLFGGA